jgi:hypothetical protein
MDARTPLEKKLWTLVGPPLYYCAQCLRAVKVRAHAGQEPTIQRKCECRGQIIAPRKALAVGEGGMNLRQKVQVTTSQAMSAITGRCV